MKAHNGYTRWLVCASVLTLGLASCGQPASENNPGNEQLPSQDDTVSEVQSPQETAGTLAALASEAATFQGDSGELLAKLNELDQAAQKVAPQLDSDVRTAVNQDLQSMRDAVDAEFWQGAQESAASIAEQLDKARQPATS